MCGLLGTISDAIGAEAFRAAARRLRHRGPYAEGVVVDGDTTLAMTRLPMSSSDTFAVPVRHASLIVSYNGEIYGPARGLNLLGEIEVLVSALFGAPFPDGMYAFAAFDLHSRRLYIGRDSWGIKPLYYYMDPAQRTFIFASEIAPILELLGKVRPNRQMLADVAATGVSLDYATPFEGISQLEPGTVMCIKRASNGALVQQVTRTPQCLAHEEVSLDQALGSAVADCATTFREVGLLTSGGMDSTLLSSYLPPNVQRFYVDVQGMSDPPHSGGPLHVLRLGEDTFWQTLRRALRNFASPTRMSSIVMYQCLTELVSEHGYHCVLMGEGADELFWGYPRHVAMFEQQFSLDVDALAQLYFGAFAAKAEVLERRLAARTLERVRERVADLLRGGVDKAVRNLDHQYSLEPLLRRADHVLMANAIEARTPYLHGRVPSVAARAGRARIQGGKAKRHLAELTAGRVSNYTMGHKRHFRVPFDEWPRVDAEMREYLNDSIVVLENLGLERLDAKRIAGLPGSELFTLTTMGLWHEMFQEYLA